ncbi:uncharacterized protein LAESUDRAFT_673338 [Laetiporus sulphureus 93-53]|uniref:MYND-type domain-containing protein n=1 Tax=Laetiporus sulphureus 93-53 TaxID=1314785 RepID=A0A165GMC3_9APHY|nr:uncharacterized protein LAESUDRAFT_673338 [Laetiporus sulphureus 93-53]KZT10550.1 hypothetical protein LAESUDRAFT_673338 [Laetiporus sulphureus 93-53]
MAENPLADLRDRLAFPPFADCPSEDDLDERYISVDGEIATHQRHWCFLGEIIDYIAIGRLTLDVRDVSGKLVRASFYDEDKGMRYVRGGGLKKGYTLALLYPWQHYFLDQSCGFRMETSEDVKIIPCSLKELMSANDKLQRGLPVAPCWTPGCEKTEDLRTCSKCHKAKYCGKEHQTQEWKAGHRQECKAFVELEWFLTRDWSTFDGGSEWSFPA